MRKTITLIAAGLLTLTASCTYYTNSGNYSSKGYDIAVVRPAPVVVQPVVRPVYYTPVIEPPIMRRTYTYTYTYTPYSVYCD